MSDIAVNNIRTRRMARTPRPAEIPTAITTGLAAVKTLTPTKASLVIACLSRPSGASLAELGQVTGWQAHSIRAFLTGLRKKGNIIDRGKREDGVTIYRVCGCESEDGDAREVTTPLGGNC